MEIKECQILDKKINMLEWITVTKMLILIKILVLEKLSKINMVCHQNLAMNFNLQLSIMLALENLPMSPYQRSLLRLISIKRLFNLQSIKYQPDHHSNQPITLVVNKFIKNKSPQINKFM
jgi:hypothetical protein